MAVCRKRAQKKVPKKVPRCKRAGHGGQSVGVNQPGPSLASKKAGFEATSGKQEPRFASAQLIN